jgi:hypothetical protein
MVRPAADANPPLLDLFGLGVRDIFLHLAQHLFSVVFGHVPRNFPFRHSVSLAKRSQFIFYALVGEKEIRAFESIRSGLRSLDL